MKHECQGAAKIWMWFLFKYRCRDRKLAFIRARLDWKVNVCVLSETTLWLWSLLGYWCVKLWIVQQTFIKELSNSYKLFNNIRICLAFLLDLIFPPAAKFVNAPLLFKIVFFLNQWMNAPSVFCCCCCCCSFSHFTSYQWTISDKSKQILWPEWKHPSASSTGGYSPACCTKGANLTATEIAFSRPQQQKSIKHLCTTLLNLLHAKTVIFSVYR